MSLHECVRNDDMKSLQNLIHLGQPVNSQEGDMKHTALHVAATKGNVKATEILINSGANPYLRNKRGAQPLHLAITYHQLEIVNLLLSHDPLLFNETDGNGNTLLHIAVWKKHFKIVKLLLKQELNMSLKNKDGNTVYHMAILWNRPHILTTLLKYSNRFINEVNLKGMSPLCLATYKDYECCVQRLLMYGASYKKEDRRGKKPIDFASEKIQKLFIKFEIFKRIKTGCAHGMASIIARREFDVDSSSALHIASLFADNRLIIQQLVMNGAKVNMLDENNKTALCYAIQAGCVGPIQVLLRGGAELSNIRLSMGQTPLHIAIQRQDYELTKLLLKYKANVNIRNENGDTPLLYAVVNRSRKLVKLLMKYDVDVLKTDRNGNTPLHLAVTANNIPMCEDLLPYSHVVLDDKNEYGRTPLMCAILGRNIKLTKLLMDNGASLDKQDNKGVTAYKLALSTNDEVMIKNLSNLVTNLS